MKPEKWFHKSTREFPLSRAQKAKLQIEFSKMDKARLKRTIKTLEEMEYSCLEGEAKIKWAKIGKKLELYSGKKEVYKTLVEPLNPDLRDEFRMAIWCRFCRELAQKYLTSLEAQKKI